MDAIAGLTKKAIEDIKITGTPALFEIMTYRYRGHVGVEEDFKHKYRERSELDKYMQKDPLITNKILILKFKKNIEDEINEAVDFAEKSPFPDRNDLLKGCY